MLLLALVAVVMPAIFELVRGHGLPGVGDLRVDYGHKVEVVVRAGRGAAAPELRGLASSSRYARTASCSTPYAAEDKRRAPGPCDARW